MRSLAERLILADSRPFHRKVERPETDREADVHGILGREVKNYLQGAEAGLDLEQLAARIGWDAPLLDLKSRLRCSRCGSREVQTSLVYQPPPSTGVGYISL